MAEKLGSAPGWPAAMTAATAALFLFNLRLFTSGYKLRA
jgi:hypothetical protein